MYAGLLVDESESEFECSNFFFNCTVSLPSFNFSKEQVEFNIILD